jgi:nicotinic acid mononucleotide adenylyltransferase
MSLADHAVRLAELHESAGFTATRFDPGATFGGRVAVLPSAYNPPTRAHLGLLDLAGKVKGVSAVAAMLTTNNVDKSLFGAPLSHRVGMLLALHQESPYVGVVASNAARLMDQGMALHASFPGVEFDFIVGFDTLVRLFDVKYYEDMGSALDRFFASHRVIATNRAEATLSAVRDFVSTTEVRRYSDRIVVRELHLDHARLSSTAARGDVAAGEGGGALTAAVAAYVDRFGLYTLPSQPLTD